MDSPERCRSYAKREMEDGIDVKSERARDDEEWEGSDKRKHRSSKSRKPSNGEEAEGLDSSGRRRSSGDRNESRKRPGGSNKADSDEDDYDTRKEQRSKQLKRKQEESSLEKLSSWYQDGEIDNRKDGGDKSGSRGHSRADESERRKVSSKFSEHESSRSGSKIKEDRSHDGEFEKTLDRDSRYSDKRESGRDKGNDSSEQGRSSRRRWDDSDTLRKAEETNYERADMRSGRTSDSKYESSKERSASARHESSESKSRGIDSNSEKGIKSNNREERRIDSEKSKSKGRSEALEEENRASPISHEDRSVRDKNEKHRQQRTPTARDIPEGRERSSIKDEDGNTWMKDKSVREVGRSNRSRTPERSGRRHQDSEHSEGDYERSIDLKRKEHEKDSHRDDRTKARDDGWIDRNRDREGSKDNWKRKQPNNNDKDSKDGDIFYDRGREWELPRHGRERNDHDRPHGRSGNRKDGSRGEAVKTSSNFGISNENYDVIEIQTKPLDYGRAEAGPSFSRRPEVGHQSDVQLAPNEQEWPYMEEDRAKRSDIYGSGLSGEDSRDRFMDDGTSMRDLNSWRDEIDYKGGKGRGQKGNLSGRPAGSAGGSQPPYGNPDSGSFGRTPPQGGKGSRAGRGGRGRLTGRDNQQVGVPLPMMGSPFGPLGMPPPGPMQPLNPNMSPAPGPPISPGVFIPPFSPPVVWPGPRGVDMNMLGVPPGLSPVPPGPSGPRFPPNMGTPMNPGMYFNQSGPGRGGPPSMSGPGFNANGPVARGTAPDKPSGSWAPPRSSGTPGKAPSRGEQNDYSQNFVDTGMRPQNFIRELELTNVVEDYPKLRELIQKKDEIVSKSATAPVYFKCDLREFELSPEFFGTKFDVILVDPPWEEYVHRAPGVADQMEYWTFEEILNLKIEAIADTPSFIFLWVGDGVGLEQGRQCLKKWGFRRCCRYNTLGFATVASFLGLQAIQLTAAIPTLHPPHCAAESSTCKGPTAGQMAFLLSGFGLMIIGAGGVRPCNLAFGADQFNPNTESGKRGINSFFNWYFCTFTFAQMVSLTLIVYVQSNMSWAIGLAIPALLMLVACVVFFMGTKIYVRVPATGSPMTSVAQVIVVAVKKRQLKQPDQPLLSLFNYIPPGSINCKLRHTDQFRFLDKAAMLTPEDHINPDGSAANRWRLCSVQQVEEVKCVLRVIPTWFAAVIFHLMINQQHTYAVFQAQQSNRRLGNTSFKIPAASYVVFMMLSMTIWIPIYDRIFVPFLRRLTGKEGGITLLQRMGIGIGISIIAMLVSGVVEEHRRTTALTKPTVGFQPRRGAVSSMSGMFLIPQFALAGLADAFTSIGLVEFYYKQFPENMRSIGGSLFFCALAGSSYLSSLLITIVHQTTQGAATGNWLPEDLNKGRLDYYYYMIAGLEVLNLGYFLVYARWYEYKETGTGSATAIEFEANGEAKQSDKTLV